MELSEFTLRIMVLLIPGIVGVLIIDKIAIHDIWTPFLYLLYSFVIGFFSYVVLQFILYLFDIVDFIQNNDCKLTQLTFWVALFSPETKIQISEVLKATGLSVIISFVISYANDKKYLNKFSQFIKVSSKYGDEYLYYYFLNSQDVYWVYVKDIRNDLTYFGLVDTFSIKNETIELLLRQVEVYTYYEPSETPLYAVERVYLSLDKSNIIIESPYNYREGQHAEES